MLVYSLVTNSSSETHPTFDTGLRLWFWNHVTGGPLVFDSRRPPGRTLVTSINLSGHACSFLKYDWLYLLLCNYSKSAFSHHEEDKRHVPRYVAHEEPATWYDARSNCLFTGGDLAAITDLERMEEDWSGLKENQKYWIGLYRQKWIWNSTGDQYCHFIELADIPWVVANKGLATWNDATKNLLRCDEYAMNMIGLQVV